MFQSLKIGQPFGIGLYLHPTFWLLPLFVILTGGSSPAHLMLDLAVLFAVFGCVALHELGHALAARGYGIPTRDIILYPLGGVARLENMPRQPLPEIVIALAGPAVNVVIAIGIWLMLALDGVTSQVVYSGPISIEAFWSRLLVANVVLVLFNMIPAFPMDGGRVFRAVVSFFTDRVTATEIASIVGTIFAGLIGIFGLVQMNFMLVILAFAVWSMGRSELEMVRREAADQGGWNDSPRSYARRAARRVVDPVPMNGWEFDPITRMWTEWQDGYAVRRVRA